MMINEIFEDYKNSVEEYEKKDDDYQRKIDAKVMRIETLQKEVEKLQAKRNKLRYPSWIEMLLKPLAAELAERLNLHYDIYGPFGLRAQTSIYFMADPKKSITDQPVKRLSVVPVDLNNGILHYETGRRKEGLGSLGDLNGMGNETLPLPNSIEEILKILQVDED